MAEIKAASGAGRQSLPGSGPPWLAQFARQRRETGPTVLLFGAFGGIFVANRCILTGIRRG